MNELALLIFAVFTATIVFFNLAESAGDQSLHKVPIPDKAEDESGDTDRSGRAGAIAVASANNGNRLLHTSVQLVPAPANNQLPAVECYVCTDCPKVDENTPTKTCPVTFDVTRRNRCVVYTEKYKHMKRSWFIRGCASERGSCADIKKAHAAHADIVNLLFCQECEGDNCNRSGAYRSLSDITLALFALVISPMIAKYTLC